jgi:hypothetical protein
MSLIPTRDQIVNTLAYRWPRICVHPEVWSLPKKLAGYNFETWTEVKFNKANLSHFTALEGQEGIYMSRIHISSA